MTPPFLGIGLGMGGVPSMPRGLDPATRAFVAASGATETDALDAWVRGIKALGIWSGIITWPMRSGQNASGATIYSLGGLATANATQTGTPTVGAAGRVITLTSEVATTAWTATATQAAIGTVVDLAATGSADQRIISYDVAGTAQGLGIDRFHATEFRRLGSSFLAAFGTQSTSPSLLAVGGGSPGTFYAQDGSYTDDADAALTTPFSPVGVIGRSGHAVAPGTYAMSFYYEGNLTSALYASLRTLYKATIGSGLGLP